MLLINQEYLENNTYFGIVENVEDAGEPKVKTYKRQYRIIFQPDANGEGATLYYTQDNFNRDLDRAGLTLADVPGQAVRVAKGREVTGNPGKYYTDVDFVSEAAVAKWQEKQNAVTMDWPMIVSAFSKALEVAADPVAAAILTQLYLGGNKPAPLVQATEGTTETPSEPATRPMGVPKEGNPFPEPASDGLPF